MRHFESPHLQASGVVVADVAEQYSHWTAVESLSEWCAREGVPAISGVDTRAIVTYLREQGSSLARITIGEEYDADQDEAFVDPEQINLVEKVSTKAPFHVSSPQGDLHVAVLDCGVKESRYPSFIKKWATLILRFRYPPKPRWSGCKCDCFPVRLSHSQGRSSVSTAQSCLLAARVMEAVPDHPNSFDGIFISNGPGDPTHCQETVYHLRKVMESSQIPIMGNLDWSWNF